VGRGHASLTDLHTWPRSSKPFRGIGRLLIYPSTGGPLRAAGGRDVTARLKMPSSNTPLAIRTPRNCSWGPRNIHCRMSDNEYFNSDTRPRSTAGGPALQRPYGKYLLGPCNILPQIASAGANPCPAFVFRTHLDGSPVRTSLETLLDSERFQGTHIETF
jgi:hypothetical protein